jgi:hypothetical protein
MSLKKEALLFKAIIGQPRARTSAPGKLTGFGEIITINGKISGNWINGSPDGIMNKETNRNIYKGPLNTNYQMNGTGVLQMKMPKVIISGNWINGSPHGIMKKETNRNIYTGPLNKYYQMDGKQGLLEMKMPIVVIFGNWIDGSPDGTMRKTTNRYTYRGTLNKEYQMNGRGLLEMEMRRLVIIVDNDDHLEVKEKNLIYTIGDLFTNNKLSSYTNVILNFEPPIEENDYKSYIGQVDENFRISGKGELTLGDNRKISCEKWVTDSDGISPGLYTYDREVVMKYPLSDSKFDKYEGKVSNDFKFVNKVGKLTLKNGTTIKGFFSIDDDGYYDDMTVIYATPGTYGSGYYYSRSQYKGQLNDRFQRHGRGAFNVIYNQSSTILSGDWEQDNFIENSLLPPPPPPVGS